MKIKKIIFKLVFVAIVFNFSAQRVNAVETQRFFPCTECTKLDLLYVTVPQMKRFDELPINSVVSQKVADQLESVEVDGRKMTLQPVSDDYFLSFYNATGLDASHRFGPWHAFKLFSHKHENSLVRLAVFNEITSLLRTKSKLVPNLEEAINFKDYKKKIEEIERLEEHKRWMEEKLKELNPEIAKEEGTSGSASKNLYEIMSRMLRILSEDGFQNLSQQKEVAFQNLLENAKYKKAFNVHLINFNDGGKKIMCLKRTQESDTQHLTLMDAFAFFHEMGLRIFTLESLENGQGMKKKLQLFHSFIPQNATRVAYLTIDSGRFSALLPK